MQRETRSILKELNDMLPNRNGEQILESRASHVVNSAINLMEQLHANLPKELAEEMEKRFLNAVKNRDHKKLQRGFEKMRNKKDD